AAEAAGPDVDRAAESWSDVIAQYPDALAPRRELARVYRDAERWKPLVEVLKEAEERAARAPTDKGELLREMAEVYKGPLRNEQQAISLLNDAIAADPDNLAVYDELAAYYESKKRWPDLVSTLGKKAERLPELGARVELYLGIANLRSDEHTS